MPPLASTGQQPVTHIVFDSSGSMRFRAHQDANNKYNYDLNKSITDTPIIPLTIGITQMKNILSLLTKMGNL